MEYKVVSFIGTGKLATTLIRGLIKAGYPKEKILATNRTELSARKVATEFKIQTTCSNIEAIEKADVVIFAVKPADICPVIYSCQNVISDKQILISLAAGVNVATIDKVLIKKMPVVRAMPNTPASINQATTCCIANGMTSKQQLAWVDAFFSLLGKVFWLEKEALMNPATALTGCGPAYVFSFMNCFIELAKTNGFDHQQASEMVMQLFQGAVDYAANSTLSVPELIDQVASKGGVTEKALQVFQKEGLADVLANAVKVAKDHGEAISREISANEKD